MILFISWEHSKHFCLKDASNVFQGCFKGVSMKFQRNFKQFQEGLRVEVLRVFQGSFKGYKKVSGGSLRSFKAASQHFQG